MPNVHILYYAMLREASGKDKESVTTDCKTADALYAECKAKYNFTLGQNNLRVAINEEFQAWDTMIKDGDTVVFIPPVAGG